METSTLFLEAILPLPVQGTFTYRIPRDKYGDVEIGKRVVVQFGKKKIYAAIVCEIHERIPKTYQAKYILDIIDEKPVVNEIQLSFWKWLSDYYMSALGEVMNVALPSGLKLASETRILLNPDKKPNPSALNEKENKILEALGYQHALTIHEISKLLDQKKVMHIIKNLLDKSLIYTQEEVQKRFRPKIETFVSLNPELEDEKKLREVFEELGKKAFKQLQLLLSYINLSRNSTEKFREVRKADLIKSVEATHQQFNALAKKRIFETYEKAIHRIEYSEASKDPASIEFSKAQHNALDSIKKQFVEKDVVLLHGVTSSGKTEIYIKLIHEALAEGKQALFLLPEIALTTQIIQRLIKYFGSMIGVYHSRFNENERVEIWNRLLDPDDNIPVIIGARSALFLPFSNLGLIIVDEEYDHSYKQFDPAPRYNARDGAIYLGSLHGSKIILGSATPSYETYYNALSGKYGLVNLKERYQNMPLPEVMLVDLRKDHITSKRKSHFSSVLLDEMKQTVENKKQVILFQNRRGFSLRLECNQCGHTPSCSHCDITLTYHKAFNQLKCHYCGYSEPVPSLCPECGSKEIFMKGFGTEKVEEELSIFLPEAKVQRMDLDTTRGKYAHQKIINDFESGKIDILVGTQMVTKGLDFNNVSLVGIMNADNMLNFPDFRSFERSFQLMLQVSGRAGRKDKPGKVLIQTYNPGHPVLHHITKAAYNNLFREQMMEREQFKYPPFFRIIKIRLKHRDHDQLNTTAEEFANELRSILGQRVLGPEYPLVSRIKNQYIKDILVKSEKEASVSWIKKKILETIALFSENQQFKSIQVALDVDPY